MPVFTVTLTRGAQVRDITADVIGMRWRLGMARPYDPVAAPARGVIVVNNRSQDYSPEANFGDPVLAPLTFVQIGVTHGEVSQTLFTGMIAHVAPEMGGRGSRRALIYIEAVDAWLRRVTVRIPVQTGVRADEVLDTIMDVPPLNLLSRDFDEGASEFAYVGDTWGGGVRAITAVRQTVEAERGRFYLSRAGVLAFRNRDFGLSGGAPATTFDDAAEQGRYTYGAGLVNLVRVGLRPRSLGSAGSTLWTLANAQLLRADAGLRIIVPLRDSQARPCGAVDVTPPVPTTDYTANTAKDGTGSDATAQVEIDVLALEGSAAKLRIRNTGGSIVYLMPGARLRGTPLLGGDPAAVEVSDDDSVAEYGPHPLNLSLPLLDDMDAADIIAALELEKRAGPRGTIHTLTLSERVRYTDAIDRTLFDRIRVIDAQTGHDADYWIIAESHHVTHGGACHQVTWLLEPAPTT